MQFYPAGESICRELLQLPQQELEWIITGASVDEIVAAGFQRLSEDGSRFVHPESGDLYQLARRQYIDPDSGDLRFCSGSDVSVEDELATRSLTILAMARDGADIIDPFGGNQDLEDGILRHTTPYFSGTPANLLTVAVWAARLAVWGFSVAHGTHALMKKMVTDGATERIAWLDITEAVLQVMASPRPSAFFRLLHSCDALRRISPELERLFEEYAPSGISVHPYSSDNRMPEAMRKLDQVAAKTDNISTVLKCFNDVLGANAAKVFIALGLDRLHGQVHTTGVKDLGDS